LSCSRGQDPIVNLSGGRDHALGMVAAHRRHHPRCCRRREVHIYTCTPARMFRMASAPRSLTCAASRREELDDPSNLESHWERAWDHASVRYKMLQDVGKSELRELRVLRGPQGYAVSDRVELEVSLHSHAHFAIIEIPLPESQTAAVLPDAFRVSGTKNYGARLSLSPQRGTFPCSSIHETNVSYRAIHETNVSCREGDRWLNTQTFYSTQHMCW